MVTRYAFRLYLLGLVMAAGFVVLLWRLWVVQIEDHKKYVAQLPQASTVVQRVPGFRGEIKDRNGIPLAVNRVIYEIKLDLREIVRAYKARHKGEPIPKHTYWQTDSYGTRREHEEEDVFEMYATDVAPRLERLGLLEDLNANSMRLHYRTNRGVIPFSYSKEVPFDKIAVVAEQASFLEGVSISRRTIRHYPFKSMLSHVLGYTKTPGPLERPEDAKEYDFFEVDDYGVAGVELTMESLLRPRAGRRVYPKDEHGKIIYDEIVDLREDPIKGNDVYLSIDVRLQYIAEMALREANITRGAVVVLDPDGGDVLAMVSLPNYDPNKFIPAIDPDDWKAYIEDKATPLMNRAISDQIPGSTYKVPIAVAGEFAGLAGRSFPCGGGMQLGNHFSKCWIASKGGNHGTLGLSAGLMNSCNGFFFRYGLATGIKRINEVCSWFGLGQPTGIDLPAEDSGNNAGPATSTTGWTDAETAFLSMGQGQVLATPLQMCSVAATIANGGVVYRPKLIMKTYDHADKQDTLFPERPMVDLIEKGIKPKDFELVRKGMWMVVNGPSGTAKAAKSVGFETAGKTGTAQTSKIDPATRQPANDTWFIAFAPYDKPKYAVCVFVENGKGGGVTAAPVAARILKQAMAMSAGAYQPPVAPLDEVKGNFAKHDAITYPDDPVDAAALAAALSDDETPPEDEAATRTAASPSLKKKKPAPASPTLKAKPDTEGRRARGRPQPRPAEASRASSRSSKPRSPARGNSE